MTMPPSNSQLPEVLALAQALPGLGHKARGPQVRATAAALGVSPATLYRWMEDLGHGSARKPRADRGRTKVDADLARKAASLLTVGTRATGKQLPTQRMAIDILNADAAANFDRETGEVKRLECHPSTLARAMRQLGCHPTQLARPTPAHPMQSPHPNWLWQVDVSTCVLFYLANGGMEICDVAVFNKNKPSNYERIKELRVQRYLAVDHCTGAFYLAYLPGHETSRNLLDFLIPAFHARPGDPFHGVPKFLGVDPGSAQAAPVVRNLARGLDMTVLVHEAGNARAKGGVEVSHNVVERQFEGRLVAQKVRDFAHLNELATQWSLAFQSTVRHSRHRLTRFEAQMRIKPEELRLAPGLDITRALVLTDPVLRPVSTEYTISFAAPGHEARDYLVRDLPGVAVGEKLRVVASPYQLPAIDVLIENAEGVDVRHTVQPIPLTEWAFPAHAAVVGLEFKSMPDSHIDRERKTALRAAWGTDDAREIAKKRRGKAVAFDGELDAMADVKAVKPPAFLPRRGTPLAVSAPAVAAVRMSCEAAILRLQMEMQEAWRPEFYAFVSKRFGAGLTEAEFEGLRAQFLRTEQREAQAC